MSLANRLKNLYQGQLFNLCLRFFLLLKISLLEMIIAFGNEHLKNLIVHHSIGWIIGYYWILVEHFWRKVCSFVRLCLTDNIKWYCHNRNFLLRGGRRPSNFQLLLDKLLPGPPPCFHRLPHMCRSFSYHEKSKHFMRISMWLLTEGF